MRIRVSATAFRTLIVAVQEDRGDHVSAAGLRQGEKSERHQLERIIVWNPSHDGVEDSQKEREDGPVAQPLHSRRPQPLLLVPFAIAGPFGSGRAPGSSNQRRVQGPGGSDDDAHPFLGPARQAGEKAFDSEDDVGGNSQGEHSRGDSDGDNSEAESSPRNTHLSRHILRRFHRFRDHQHVSQGLVLHAIRVVYDFKRTVDHWPAAVWTRAGDGPSEHASLGEEVAGRDGRQESVE